MRIAMVGAGYVGLVSSACLAEFGIEVACVDSDQARVEALQEGRVPIFEPGLDLLIQRHTGSGRLAFTTDLETALAGAEAVFIAVGTPSRRGDGHADLSFVFSAARAIAAALTGPALIVTKSTVPVGTGRRLKALFEELRPDLVIDVASNPEFLREGSAIEDFMRPDRIVCGVETAAAETVLRTLYRPLDLIETPILFTGIETAELIKYASNSFLATKITFINEMADLCEAVGADVHDVARGMGLDSRIGRKFLHPGPGYGGSCFPKDVQALLHTALENGIALRLVETVAGVNAARKRQMVERIVAACEGDLRGRRIGVLGITFKPDTDDIRDSPALLILPELQARGAVVAAYDPAGMDEGRRQLPGVHWCEHAEAAMAGSDALVVLTEWKEFRGLDLERVRALLRHPVIIDLRNIFDPRDVRRLGFAYHALGRAAEPQRRILS